MSKANSISSSMIFKTLERYFVMAFQLIVQIVIARILTPDDYGIVAMMSVFITVATVFIQNGFNMAIVQKKDASEDDYGTALTVNFSIGVLLYLLIVVFSDPIASFYNQPLIKTYMPIMALLLIIGAINSIQIAIANRSMHFKDLFTANVISSVVSGIMGILAAIAGLGVWALIIQQLGANIILCILLFLQQHWIPRFRFDKKSAFEMFSYGWKLFAAGLINQLYNELNSLVIGKKYASADLAFYTKGSQFPKLITMGIDTSIASVMFSAFSRNQEDEVSLHILMKKTHRITTFLVIPCLMILAIVADPLVTILLTEKWLPLVPYMQLCCITFALHPLAAAQTQAVGAIGRSDMRLKLEFIKKGIGLLLLYLSLPYGPYYIALSAAFTSIIGIIIGSIVTQNLVHYKIVDMLKDILPTFLISIPMGVCIYFLMQLQCSPLLLVFTGVIVGLIVYLLLAHIFKIYGYLYLRTYIKDKLSILIPKITTVPKNGR